MGQSYKVIQTPRGSFRLHEGLEIDPNDKYHILWFGKRMGGQLSIAVNESEKRKIYYSLEFPEITGEFDLVGHVDIPKDSPFKPHEMVRMLILHIENQYTGLVYEDLMMRLQTGNARIQ